MSKQTVYTVKYWDEVTIGVKIVAGLILFAVCTPALFGYLWLSVLFYIALGIFIWLPLSSDCTVKSPSILLIFCYPFMLLCFMTGFIMEEKTRDC